MGTAPPGWQDERMKLADYLKKTPAERRAWELTPDPGDVDSIDLADILAQARAEGHAAGIAAERARVVDVLRVEQSRSFWGRPISAVADDIEAGRL